jgi:cell wall-associated NlpC family hydrolase
MAVTPEAFPASLSDVQRCLQSTAEKYLGTPYRRGGTDRNGFDCSGFVLTVCGECRGIKLPRTAEEMFRAGTSVAREELRLGDLVFYSTGLHSIDHVGMCLGDGRFIHASSSDGVTINGLDEEYYRTRYRGAVRLGP